MPMPKKANGANFKVADGAMTVEFDAGGLQVVYVVCLWGPKAQFGGQRPRLWCSEKLTSSGDGASVAVPEGLAMAGTQMTWSGGVVSDGAAQGRLLVSVSQEGRESESFSYDYNFTKENEAESFYDGLNFV